MIIVKVGGSLFDHPNLGPGLARWLDSCGAARVGLVPGGGRAADAARELDRVHNIGNKISHWLALRAMALMGHALASILEKSCESAVPAISYEKFAVTDVHRYFEKGDGDFPHTWAVTSDSLAAQVAIDNDAKRLILLKSIAIPAGTPWTVAAAKGWVDDYFPTIMQRVKCPVEVIDFRAVLDAHS